MKLKKIIATTATIVLLFTIVMTNSSSDILRAFAKSSDAKSAGFDSVAVMKNATVSDTDHVINGASEMGQFTNAAGSANAYFATTASNQYNFSDSELVPLSNVPEVEGYLTPQQFGAVENDTNPDTIAFRKLFQAAYNNAFNPGPGWTHAKAIYIPSGKYIIDGPIIDYHSDMRFAMFEVCGSGRESTQILFTGDGVLFDDQVPESSKNELSADNYESIKDRYLRLQPSGTLTL